MAPATIYECHDETDETSVSNQTDTQPSEKKTIAEYVDFFSKRTITKTVKPKPRILSTLQRVCKNSSREKHRTMVSWDKCDKCGHLTHLRFSVKYVHYDATVSSFDLSVSKV